MKDLHTVKKKIGGHIFEFTGHSVIFGKINMRSSKIQEKRTQSQKLIISRNSRVIKMIEILQHGFTIRIKDLRKYSKYSLKRSGNKQQQVVSFLFREF